MFYLNLALIVTAIVLFSKNLFHFFQLESYQFPGFFKVIKRNYKYSLLPSFYLFLLTGFIWFGTTLNSFFIKMLLLVVCAFSVYCVSKFVQIKNPKKPLVFTNRIKRLYGVFIVVTLFAAILCGRFVVLLPLFTLILFVLSALIAVPIEKIFYYYYLFDAKKKLAQNQDLIKIGITGSYGKTTVKNILGQILSSYYPTLISPKSFNTPMGLAITIRNFLNPSHRIFISEMGSRHLGDINELCSFIQPKIGILTSVGPQHLDTFKSLENVKKGKYELVQKLPKDGIAFFQDDESIVKELYEKTVISKQLVSLYDVNADVFIKDISISSKGSSFILKLKNGEELHCTTPLLGEHNIKNIALSVAVAKYLHIPSNVIVKEISRIQPIKNRMELIQATNYTIINDAFNSNPIGAKEAVHILSCFNNRKIIITPGMVELGHREKELNFAFGEQIGKSVDIAILVGKKRVQPIAEGILSMGFNRDNLYICESLDLANQKLHTILKNGDTVLYENDLPDNYIDA